MRRGVVRSERVPPPRRAASRRGGLVGGRPELDERHEGERTPGRRSAAAARRPHHDRRDRSDLRARVVRRGRAACGRAQVRLSRRPLSLPALGCPQRDARPASVRGLIGCGAGGGAEPGEEPPGPSGPARGRIAAPRGGGRDGLRPRHRLRRGRGRDARALERRRHQGRRSVRLVGACPHLLARRLHVRGGHGLHQRHLPERAPAPQRRAPEDGRRDPHRRQRVPLPGVGVALRIIEQAWRSDVGRQRSVNEDDLVVSPPFFAVADGMGGAKAGEVASAIAAGTFEGEAKSGEPAEAQLARILREANRRIYELAVKDESHRGKDNITVVLFRLADDAAVGSVREDETIAGTMTAEDVHAAAADEPTPAQAGIGLRESLADAPADATVVRPPERLRPSPPRRRRRRVRTLAKVLVGLALLAGVVAGLYALSRQVYFVGTNDAGLVTLYRGVPYDLPFGIELYEERYASGVPARAVPARRRWRVVDHEWRSRDDAVDLVRALERGQLDGGSAAASASREAFR